MGGADVICSDKTGTLTKNEMNLTHFWNNKEIHHVFKASSKKQLTLESFISNKENREMFVDSIIANSVEDPVRNQKYFLIFLAGIEDWF